MSDERIEDPEMARTQNATDPVDPNTALGRGMNITYGHVVYRVTTVYQMLSLLADISCIEELEQALTARQTA